jgi:hypothetical protein
VSGDEVSGDNCVLASSDGYILVSAGKGEAAYRAITPQQQSQPTSYTAPKTLQKKDTLRRL